MGTLILNIFVSHVLQLNRGKNIQDKLRIQNTEYIFNGGVQRGCKDAIQILKVFLLGENMKGGMKAILYLKRKYFALYTYI